MKESVNVLFVFYPLHITLLCQIDQVNLSRATFNFFVSNLAPAVIRRSGLLNHPTTCARTNTLPVLDRPLVDWTSLGAETFTSPAKRDYDQVGCFFLFYWVPAIKHFCFASDRSRNLLSNLISSDNISEDYIFQISNFPFISSLWINYFFIFV